MKIPVKQVILKSHGDFDNSFRVENETVKNSVDYNITYVNKIVKELFVEDADAGAIILTLIYKDDFKQNFYYRGDILLEYYTEQEMNTLYPDILKTHEYLA